MPKLKLPPVKKPNLRSKKTWGLSLLVIVILAAGGWLLFSGESPLNSGKKVYAEVAGHKIYKDEINEFKGQNKDISDHNAVKVLADKYLTEKLGSEKGVTVSDKELVAKYGKAVKKQKDNNKYAYQSRMNQLYFAKLQAYNSGVYKGKVLIANFSKHIKFKPSLPEDKMHDPELGDAKAIARDKKYAEDFITRLYDDIVAGKISFDQAIKQEHKDSQVGQKAYPTLLHSGSFNTSYGPNGLISNPDIIQKINKLKTGDITKPFVIKVPESLSSSKDTVESFFLVVKMDQTSNSYTGTSFEQYIEQAKKRLGYKVYI